MGFAPIKIIMIWKVVAKSKNNTAPMLPIATVLFSALKSAYIAPNARASPTTVQVINRLVKTDIHHIGPSICKILLLIVIRINDKIVNGMA